MVVDSSALAAIVFGEDDAERYLGELEHAHDVYLSAATLLEARIVVEARKGDDAGRDLTLLIREVGMQVLPVDEAQADAAFRAWRRFGKGRHAAALNLGDCFSYALATALDEPLLFKGNDFVATDVRSALV
jgi:ribonuclease VapC